MIKAGRYMAKVNGAVVLGTSSQKGTPFIEFYLTVVKGDEAGQSVRYTGYFSDKTARRTVQSLQYCGWKGDDLGVFADGTLHGLDGSEVEIDVEIEPYTSSTGEEREAPRVAWINKSGGFLNVDNAMAPAAAAAFGEKMKGLVLKVKQGDKSTTPNAASFDKSDAPF